MKNEKLYMLIQAVRLVSLDYVEQIKLFPDYVNVPDEIAQILNDTRNIFDDSDEKGMIADNVYKKIIELDEYFGEMQKDDFSLSSLSYSPVWELPRVLAKKILSELNIEEYQPDLSWIHYTK